MRGRRVRCVNQDVGVVAQRYLSPFGVDPRAPFEVTLDPRQPPGGVTLHLERGRRQDALVGSGMAVAGLPPSRGQLTHGPKVAPGHRAHPWSSSFMEENGRPNGRSFTSIFPKSLATLISPLRLHPLAVDPCGDLVGIETDVLADLEEGDPSLGDQAADEPDFHAKPGGDLVDAE